MKKMEKSKNIKSEIKSLLFELACISAKEDIRKKYGDEAADLFGEGKQNLERASVFEKLLERYFLKLPALSDNEATQRYLKAYKKMADLLDQLISQTKQIVYEYELIALEEGNKDDNKD